MQIQATCSSNPATARGACRPIICLHCSILMRKVTGRQSMKLRSTQRGPQISQIYQQYCSFWRYMGEWRHSSTILNLRSIHVSGQLDALVPFTTDGESVTHWMGESVSHRTGVEASSLQGIERYFLGRRATRLVTISTTPSKLPYPLL